MMYCDACAGCTLFNKNHNLEKLPVSWRDCRIHHHFKEKLDSRTYEHLLRYNYSDADPDPGSGAILTPGSRMEKI